MHITEAARALGLAGERRLVPHENYHLTLAFLGDVASYQIAVLQQIGHAQRALGFTMAFDACEYWPESQVVAAVTRESSGGLIELWTSLQRALAFQPAALNLNRQHSSLRAHVTLARKVVQPPVMQAMSPFTWHARSFSLVASDTSGAHSVYTVVDTWSLLYETPPA
jgi:2'-5' RNA ligase